MSDFHKPAAPAGALVHKSRFMHQPGRIDIKGLFCCKNLVHNKCMICGYARVSTDGQSVDAQVKQLRAAGAGKVYRETASGTKADRSQLRRAIDLLEPGDMLMVTG